MRVTSIANSEVAGSSPVIAEMRCSSVVRAHCFSYRFSPILKSTAGSEGNGYFYSDKSVPLPFILRLFYKE